MIPAVAGVLKIAGLAGVGARGWGVLGVVMFGLLSTAVAPAIKAKLPWFGTEARLEKANEKIAAFDSQRAKLQGELDSCVSTNTINAAELAGLQDRLRGQREAAERTAAENRRLIDQARVQSDERRRLVSQHQRELNDVLQQETNWANTAVPGPVLECLRRAATASCDAVRDH